MSVLSKMTSCVIEGNLNDIKDLTQQALAEGISAKDVLDQGLMPGMDHVGAEFRAGNMFVPEVLRSAKTMSASMEILKPILSESGVKMVGKVILGTVKGDLHDIGKNLVGMMCEGAGFEVVDLGKDIAPEAFVEAVKEHNPDIVGMSALLTTTMRTMESTIKALEEAGLRGKVKIMVGGAPVTKDFADTIGADGYASNAAAAAEMATKFVS
ncbi:MAG TPA: corrinoid protein [Anaerolineales bacterium]|jgi:5-methyltetrahydrofolate--homocysteine methyltransferase|nr:corrinoid protein [Anaerolineales bacterium]